MLFRRNKWQMHFLWRPERQRHPIFSLLVFIALWCGSVGVHLRCKSWNAVNEILVTFYACIYKMFQFLQHCLLVVSSVIEHLFYPKNGQALQGLLIHFLKCWFAGDLCNFRLAVTLVFKQPSSHRLFLSVLRFEGFFWAGKGMSGNCLGYSLNCTHLTIAA